MLKIIITQSIKILLTPISNYKWQKLYIITIKLGYENHNKIWIIVNLLETYKYLSTTLVKRHVNKYPNCLMDLFFHKFIFSHSFSIGTQKLLEFFKIDTNLIFATNYCTTHNSCNNLSCKSFIYFASSSRNLCMNLLFATPL